MLMYFRRRRIAENHFFFLFTFWNDWNNLFWAYQNGNFTPLKGPHRKLLTGPLSLNPPLVQALLWIAEYITKSLWFNEANYDRSELTKYISCQQNNYLQVAHDCVGFWMNCGMGNAVVHNTLVQFVRIENKDCGPISGILSTLIQNIFFFNSR